MKGLFPWTIVRKDELETYRRSHRVVASIMQVHRWFAGWTDLDIIWRYVFAETYFGGIDSAREEYAKARGTDVYGSPKDSSKS